MGTRGALTFVVDGVEKTGYNHFDSYPSGLGKDVLEWLRHPEWDIDVARDAVRCASCRWSVKTTNPPLRNGLSTPSTLTLA